MRYSIGQVAKKLGLTAHTLRYYDKEGLLPFVRKGSSGARVFEDEDVDWLIIIECLKGTGMQLKDIKKYMDLCQQGDATVGERLELFRRQKEKLEQQTIASHSALARRILVLRLSMKITLLDNSVIIVLLLIFFESIVLSFNFAIIN